MSQLSSLSRYRPAILALTGAAAAYGVHMLYSTYFQRPTTSALHRSNAVHLRRRRSPALVVGYSEPDSEAPAGRTTVSEGDNHFAVDVNTNGAPTVRQVRERFPNAPEGLYTQHILDYASIQCIMNACMVAEGDEQAKHRLRQCGLGEILDAMLDRNIERLMELATPILHQFIDTEHETIQSATESFLNVSGLADYSTSRLEQRLAANREHAMVEIAETELTGSADAHAEAEQGLKGLLYHIAETDSKRKAYEHRGIRCEECGESPIRGLRWHCLNCADFDLCSTCEANTEHQKTHVFVKIKIPLPVLSQPTHVHPIWYPGEGGSRKLHHNLRGEKRDELKKRYELDDAHMDAHYDQFTAFANVKWPQDPSQVHAAIDRQAFNTALTSERWPKRFRPNALYDRMFDFYDTDHNALIGFEEFIDGLAYLRGPKRYSSLKRALEGFDIAESGYLKRDDFLRLMQAKFEIQTVLVNDIVEGQEREQTYDAMDTLRSSQPISSIFSWEDIPQGEERLPLGKARDRYGDMQPLRGTQTVLGDNAGLGTVAVGHPRQTVAAPHEQLRNHLSRFEEMLSSPEDGPSMEGLEQQPASVVQGGLPESVEWESPLDQEIIWAITREGFNEILDRFFKHREDLDQEVWAARHEVSKWRKQIDQAAREQAELRKALQNEVRSSETVDPLLETALGSMNGTVTAQAKVEAGEVTDAPTFKSDVVATDHESLTKREEEIAQKPLEDLLKETGYSTVEPADGQQSAVGATNGHFEGDGAASESSAGSPDSELERILGVDSSAETSKSPATPRLDPTMPQNRPNIVIQTRQANGNGVAVDDKTPPAEGKPPSQARLLELSEMIPQLDRIRAHGRGSLSFDEIEIMCKADETRELKGIVIDWLAWASF